MKANNQRIVSTTDSSYSLTESFLKPYRQQLKDSFSTVIAVMEEKLVKKRPGGSLGNLVLLAVDQFENKNEHNVDYAAEILKGKKDVRESIFSNSYKTKLILMNFGGIRLNEISKGKITIGRIYELLPFENTLVRIEISGKDLANLLKSINDLGGWPYKYYTRQPPVRFTTTYLNGERKLDPNSLEYLETIESCVLLTNNYLAQGGDNCSILKTLPQEDTGILLRDIVIEYLRKQKTIKADNTNYTLK